MKNYFIFFFFSKADATFSAVASKRAKPTTPLEKVAVRLIVSRKTGRLDLSTGMNEVTSAREEEDISPLVGSTTKSIGSKSSKMVLTTAALPHTLNTPSIHLCLSVIPHSVFKMTCKIQI